MGSTSDGWVECVTEEQVGSLAGRRLGRQGQLGEECE